jgi:hypothetical protein
VTWIGSGGAEIWRVGSCGVGMGGLRGGGLAFLRVSCCADTVLSHSTDNHFEG